MKATRWTAYARFRTTKPKPAGGKLPTVIRMVGKLLRYHWVMGHRSHPWSS
ncbi:MAG TPA: hypothetical protein VHK65_08455 [Candidatus Dormibacteraeota bacterium]|nr:hypothetical protein [Candidatus Dormibacteraeota bacterium]